MKVLAILSTTCFCGWKLKVRISVNKETESYKEEKKQCWKCQATHEFKLTSKGGKSLKSKRAGAEVWVDRPCIMEWSEIK